MDVRLALTPTLLLALACAGSAPAPLESPGAAAGSRSEQLYARHCVLCHGPVGFGDGFAAQHLFPPPRDFSSGRFRLVSSANGAPSDDDLVAVLRRGMPGSSMPSFDWLSAAELRDLARHVRALALDGVSARLARDARALSDAAGALAARADAERMLTPGPAVELPAPFELGSDEMARGRRAFVESCAPCHGPDGAGTGLPPLWNDDGTFVWARDFTRGVLKGGASREALSRRILLGMPGTSMPGFVPAREEDLDALVAHVQSLLASGAENRLVQQRTTLRAARARGDLPTAPDDPAWGELEQVELPLAPMVWGSEAILSATVAAVHDGETIALRLRWSDESMDMPGGGDAPESEGVDGVALALSAESEPPVFGMGSPEHPVDLWHWRADRMVDLAGFLDLYETPPQVLHDPTFDGSQLDVRPLYLPAVGPYHPTDEVRSIRAEGAQDFPQADSTAFEVSADARWRDGTWSVVLTRPLDSAHDRAVPLVPGAVVQLALAIWNSSAPSSLASKSLTIWHRLQLAP